MRGQDLSGSENASKDRDKLNGSAVGNAAMMELSHPKRSTGATKALNILAGSKALGEKFSTSNSHQVQRSSWQT